MTPGGFSGSYRAEDVTFLVKQVAFGTTDVDTKEALIQSGERHYSEMLSPETPPTPDYLALYDAALARNGQRLANDIAALAATLDARHPAGKQIVLVSLLRAGTPIAILVARALRRLGRAVAHYGISIIRDRGIDHVALDHILQHHRPDDLVFVDGWTGKGMIASELRSSVAGKLNPYLLVVADPAGQADLAATHDDYVIASSLLNSVVSGLVSRTILHSDVVGPADYHACRYYAEFAPFDRSRDFADHIDALAPQAAPLIDDSAARAAARASCEALVADILAHTQSDNRHLIKPGIAEATRAVLRRVPDRLYIRDTTDPDVQHLVHLADSRGITVEPLNHAGHFRAVAVIRRHSA
jgi:Phosphoribosyl transferase (PRTase)/PELOTA RNA binding domain